VPLVGRDKKGRDKKGRDKKGRDKKGRDKKGIPGLANARHERCAEKSISQLGNAVNRYENYF